MTVRIRLWIFLPLALLLAFAAFSLLKPKPQYVELTDLPAAEFQAVIERMYAFSPMCDPSLNLEELGEILLDTRDYQLTKQDRSNIQSMYGNDALKGAGYLTAQKAYYQSRRTPVQVTPPPGVLPTHAPEYICSGKAMTITLRSIMEEKDGKVIVQYAHGQGVAEAVLRKHDAVWKICSVKTVEWWGA